MRYAYSAHHKMIVAHGPTISPATLPSAQSGDRSACAVSALFCANEGTLLTIRDVIHESHHALPVA